MQLKNIARAGLVLFVLSSGQAQATPSTTYWTPMTPDIQSYGVLHFGVDNYFTGNDSFPTDMGLTLGVLPFDKVQMEIGIDVLEPSDDPVYFNAKIGTPENTLFEGAPTLQLGIFNAGTNGGETNQNVGYMVIGKTIPWLGRLSIGPYIGNGHVLRDSSGDKENAGFMAAFDRGFFPKKNAAGEEYNRVVLAADYAYGDNAIGGGGFGVYYFFTKNISLLTGPVWFNDSGINGSWKWTAQLDINLAVFGPSATGL